MPKIDVSEAVNAFIAVCRDEERFYSKAAEKVGDPCIRGVFQNMASIRQATIAELAPFVEAQHEPVARHGTLAGATHRLLSSLEASLSGDATKALIAQLEESEELSYRRLSEIARQPLPDPLRALLEEKLAVFAKTREQMRALRAAKS